MIDEIRGLKAARFHPCHCDRNCALNYGDKKKEKSRVQKANCGAWRTRDGYFQRLCVSLSVGGGVQGELLWKHCGFDVDYSISDYGYYKRANSSSFFIVPG
ncbi:hypothetical protein CEXT_192031 [Caerostris extrusa]|uniref:Uncharacterized protein n=1 Tax=Caerostris extrusa TaxID=172846 RepID=A0AAV4UW37_CAEEX|nr:hypothetical protein CEXT_192031 [Caerostris extrusa]